MSETELTADRFIEALHLLESEKSPDDLVGLFAENASLGSGAPCAFEARRGDPIREFWNQDAELFDGMSSEFLSVVESDGEFVLEWRRTGTAGEIFGVSIAKHSNGRIDRFVAYFDRAAVGAVAV